jgi:hypothetical protein
MVDGSVSVDLHIIQSVHLISVRLDNCCGSSWMDPCLITSARRRRSLSVYNISMFVP